MMPANVGGMNATGTRPYHRCAKFLGSEEFDPKETLYSYHQEKRT